MSAQLYHKRYHSDALAGFMSLNLEERGAYQTILDLIYDRGGALPDNPRLLAGYMGCSLRKWSVMRQALIDKGKIYLLADGSISNARAEKEIENYLKMARIHAENGAKGGRKKTEAQNKFNEINEQSNRMLSERSSIAGALEARSYIEDITTGIVSETARKPENTDSANNLSMVLRAAGMINVPSDHRLVGEWLAAGADLASDIIPTVERISSEVRGRTGQTPFKLKLFDDAIRRKVADEAAFVDARKLSIARMNRLKIEQGEQALAGAASDRGSECECPWKWPFICSERSKHRPTRAHAFDPRTSSMSGHRGAGRLTTYEPQNLDARIVTDAGHSGCCEWISRVADRDIQAASERLLCWTVATVRF